MISANCKRSGSRWRFKHRFASLICCGSSRSRAYSEREIHRTKPLASSLKDVVPVSDESQHSKEESSSIFGLETGLSSSTSEDVNSSEGASSEYGVRNIETRNNGKSHSESIEVHPHQVNACCYPMEENVERNCGTTTTSFKQQSSSELGSGKVADQSLVSSEEICSSSVSREPESLCLDGESVGDSDTSFHTSDSGSISVVSNSIVTVQLLGDDSTQEVPPPPGSGLSNRGQDPRNGNTLLLDMVSNSSNILSTENVEINNREARRHSRRLFWDAFSTRSFRSRSSDSPSLVFTTSHTDDLGSHDRWVLDITGELHYDGTGHDFRYTGTGSHLGGGRQWQSRYEISQQFYGGLDEEDSETSLCASGVHPDGTCSCESIMGEESSTQSSISRIMMLAGALFEVLDEIHRNPVSSSLSMVSLPAPESVVDSFPIKNHKKSDAIETGPHDVKQCYICLAEYEEGDKIRVLPCSHEYHVSCVDKWLKEIHSVCPVCRGDICKGVVDASASDV